MRVLAVLLACVLTSAPALASHVQTDFGHEASFDHVKGNEWWVEVDVDHNGELHGVDARDEGGAWAPLEKKSWGVWAGSFHIEPGHDVQFRAHQGDFGRIESCWFTHPEGQELCQSDWHVTQIDKASDREYLHDTTIADVDGDGVQELLVAATDGIRIYASKDGGWSLRETVAGDELFGGVETGDLDADGRLDIVAENIDTDIQFTRLEYDGTWQRMDYLGPAQGGSAFTVGDPDGDGVAAVYISDHGPDVSVYEVRLVEDAWQETEITRVSEGVDILHVGDGDGDGDSELYAGGGYKGDDSLFQIEYGTGGWSKTQIGTEHGSSSVFAIGTGDADGDGRSELYHTTEDPNFDVSGLEYSLWKNTFVSGSWTQESIATFTSPAFTALVADGDNDGAEEVYVAVTGKHDLRIIQVEKTASGWSKDRVVVADGGGEPRLAAGDPDGDGLTELASIEKRLGGFVQTFSEDAPGSGGTQTSPFTFDHNGGNEWWVQVAVAGGPERVQAMDTDGAWHELEKKDWGDWADSFHIEPGHDVRFRAMDGGTWHESCWFTHPGGKTPGGGETCSTSGEEPPLPPSGEFDASFSTPGGNEWWVEVNVDANQQLAGVSARDDGGSWISLEKKSWGAWAKSFHVQDGSTIEFRATNGNEEHIVSQGYTWPTGEPAGSDGGGSTTFDASFSTQGGNEWWVEVNVDANEPLAGVDARDDGGAWTALEKKSWGAWAKSFHVQDGSVIEFRATSTDGDQAISRGYTWPSGT